jgi:hypothetical protein
MKKIPKPPSAEAIAVLADQGKDVSGFFTGKGKMVQPSQRVNVDVTGDRNLDPEPLRSG